MGRARSSSKSSGLRLAVYALLGGFVAGFAVGFSVQGPVAPPSGAETKDLPAWLERKLADKAAGQEKETSPRRRRRAALTGVVDVQPELKGELRPSDTLFVIVTRPGEPAPLAVKRVHPVSFPFLYSIGPSDLMISGRTLDGRVAVKARVDRDGEANSPQPGDLTGEADEEVDLPARAVHILIDTRVPG